MSLGLADAGITATAKADTGLAATELTDPAIVIRIIPCLDVDNGRVVKGVNFIGLRDAGDPIELADFYSSEGADELVFLDITASSDERDTTVRLARQTAAQVHIPFTVGGGIRSVDDARRLLRAGADKVSLNTAAVQMPSLINEVSAEFGAQCTVVAIDARNTASTATASTDASPAPANSPRYEVTTHGGRTPTGKDAIAWAVEAAERGAGEILLTSMDRDGTKDGYDLPLTCAISSAVTVPVIASGGVGKLEHLTEGVLKGKADALLAASIFHYGEHSIAEAKQHLISAGIRVRPPAAR